MDSNKRLILTVLLCFAIAVAFHFLYPTPPPPAAVAGADAGLSLDAGTAGAPVPSPTIGQLPDGGVALPGTAASAPGPGVVGEAVPPVALPEVRTELHGEGIDYLFSSHGAGLVGARVLGEKNRRQGEKRDEQVDLAAALLPTDPALFELQLAGGLPALPTRAPCSLTEATDRSVAYRCQGQGVVVEKRFELGTGPGLELQVNVLNQAATVLDGTVAVLVPARVDPKLQKGSGGGCASPLSELPMPTEAVCRHGDDVDRRMHDEEEPRVDFPERAAYAGFAERYFVVVAVPVAPVEAVSSCTLVGAVPDLVEAILRTPTGPIAAGAAQTLRYVLVLGPKDSEALDHFSGALAARAGIPDPELATTVDLGIWAVIAKLLLALLKFFHGLLPNWGVAIVLLTITVKAITFPLAWKSMKSMEGIRKLTPEVEALKKKHGTDKEKLNLEMMQLYQKHKVNPFGGCVPMLIQMPVWIALYTTLQTSVELYNEPFIGGWINDLTMKDPVYVLPLVMGVTMFITQKMQPAATMDPTQAKMMLYFMPVMFTGFMLNLPSGLTLYIFTNNILSIAQQLALRRVMGMPLVGPPGGPTSGTAAQKAKG